MTNRPAEIMWAHVMRVLAIFAVIWVHASAEVFFYGAKFATYEWWVADIYDSLVRICVPLLFMVSGFLLLGKAPEPLSDFLKKRVRKVVVPLLVWSLFFLLWVNLWEYHHPSLASSMTSKTMQNIHDAGWMAAIAILWVPIYYHLWFLYALIGLYLITPVLRVVVTHAPPQLLWYFVILCLIGSMLLSPLTRITDTPDFINLNLMGGRLGYFVAGYLLGHIAISRRLLGTMVIAAIVGAFVTIVGTYYLSAANGGELSQQMWYEPMPNIIAMSVSAFLIIRYLAERCTRLQSGTLMRVVKKMSATSFGIYLVHVMFIYAFAAGTFGFHLNSMSGNPALFVPIVATLTYLASFVVIYLMQKLPVIRHAVP